MTKTKDKTKYSGHNEPKKLHPDRYKFQIHDLEWNTINNYFIYWYFREKRCEGNSCDLAWPLLRIPGDRTDRK